MTFPFHFSGAGPLELDWGASSAYSVGGVKRLLSTYSKSSPLITLRRSSDNATQNFADGGDGWVSATAIAAWLGGATGYVAKVFDQTGNGRYFDQIHNSIQPTIDLTTSKPSLNFVAANQQQLNGNNMGAFAKNVGSATLLCVRRQPSSPGNSCFMWATSGANNYQQRCGLWSDATRFYAGGRRLDTDGATTTGGLALNTSWGVQVAGFDWTGDYIYHSIDGQSDTKKMNLGGGNTSDTASQMVSVGSLYNINANMTAYAFLAGLPDRSTLISSLAGLKLS
jgi:hypothetical protein